MTPAVRELTWWWLDAWLLTSRSVRRTFRAPDTIFTMTAMPVIFFVFFGYVLGGMMRPPGQDYPTYLFPGLLVATITFSTIPAVIAAVSADLRSGITDRFRALPTSPSAVLTGRTAADGARNIIGIVVLVLLGAITGIDLTALGFGRAVASLALLLLYGFAMAWIAAFLAVVTRGGEAAQMIGTAVSGPLGFVSSLYATPESMPSWLRVFAELNPASHTGDALRSWLAGQPAGASPWYSAAWLIGIIAVLGWLTAHRFRRTTARPPE
ncbi:ABC transporter permease [Saccharopolyspora shandongensis]|uniref:ABC transporter permease n=1 Tax=Saccharopolyspora shandongensis TaxID=418495 RepID=UPI00343E980F